MNTQFGKPLVAPIKQTLLPVIEMPSGSLHGYFTIAETTFSTQPTTFALAEGSVVVTTVTPPYKGNDGSGYGVKQYVAAVYTNQQAKFSPFLGYSSFIDINHTGVYAQWFNPAEALQFRVSWGTLITSLQVNMAAIPSVAPVDPTPPVVSNGTLEWITELQLNASSFDCAFFDFNWQILFQAAMEAQQPGNTIEPLRIETLTNPPGGTFKATLVNGDGGQSYVAGGGVFFSTIRIIKLENVEAGDYDFVFRVWATNGLYTDCTLTLSVVG